jgi:large subunit ribosomal protein L24
MRRKHNSIPKLHLKKGDDAMVITGENKGKKAKVLEVFPKEGKVILEGINVVKRHQKPTAQKPDGGITEKEAPINMSNVMLIDPKSGEPTKVGRKLDEKGKFVRYAKKSGEVIR